MREYGVSVSDCEYVIVCLCLCVRVCVYVYHVCDCVGVCADRSGCFGVPFFSEVPCVKIIIVW